ncbi:hypothetical protein H072_2740 [Dactylellina haptotyla CBS 200.50]|uniref:Transcription initiation factor TFIID subunit 4 n=1 Tax=Dactylellina haptotyla (strain CBS 200.50) TaxID=1284197 RepID=S8C696_DACHA|nr:hypothetical protein H072_2740 [Dactylellina haptotyla CBS 200.50]
MPNQYPPLAPAGSPPPSQMQMPPVKRARLEPTSTANSPGPGTPISQSAFAASMSMPPPSSTSPIQKPVDTKDLSDVLFSTGVDLQAEEQYLYNDTTPAASFNASASISALQGGIAAEQRQINREEAENSGKLRHANDPFLSNSNLQAKIHQKLVDQRLGSSGNPDHFSELISIAIQERMRELVTTATVYARHRRQGNTLKGLGEWADIAFGETEGRNGRLRSEQLEGDTAPSPGGVISRKRSFAVANATSQTPRQPSLVSETAKSLRQIATDERLIEEARIAARMARINGTKPGTPAADGAGGDSTNPLPGSVAPEPEKRMTAKEAKKAQNSRLDEIQSHKAANETASLMLGGGRKKKYSWMSAGGGAGGGGGSGASTPSRLPGTPGATTGTPGATVAAAISNGPVMYWGKRMGEWNEQGERGKGVQLRDWTLALEADGRERKSLQKGYLKMK